VLAPPAVEGGTLEGTDEFIAAYFAGRITERGVDGAGACLGGYLARGGFQP